jgi:hypothetical protein
MKKEEECVAEEEIGVFFNGKIFRHNRKTNVVEREGKHSEIEKRDTGVILQIEGILHTEGKYHQLSLVE